MKRRILSTLMALVLCLTLLPAAAYAAGGTAVYVMNDLTMTAPPVSDLLQSRKKLSF